MGNIKCVAFILLFSKFIVFELAYNDATNMYIGGEKMQRINKSLTITMRNFLVCILFTLIPFSISYAKSNNDEIVPKKNITSVDNLKVIYLTFDDGPSKIMTDKALNILERYKINATFFIVGANIKGNESVLKRIYKDGNAIGLHSFTHKYKKIYRSRDEFITEMLADSFEIRRVLGISPTAIRFPGGSVKRLSKDYLELLHSYNFKVYDWNIALSDGLNPNLPTEKYFMEATKDASKKKNIILLMHCNEDNKKTIEALPSIIEYYQKLGYEFKKIKDDTPELYWKAKK